MNENKIKIIFMGTPDFSVPSLEKIYKDKDIDLLMVVTKEDKASGRGKEIHESDVKRKIKNLISKSENGEIENANLSEVKIRTPKKIREDNTLIDEMKKLNPDFIIVVAYGQILSKEILDIPKFACINGHASLLPKYRGASPIQSSILSGDKETGTTTMLMSEGMDEGDILLTKKIPINDDDTGESIFEKLSFVTADALIETIKNFDNIKPMAQDSSKATYVKMIKKEDGFIDLDNETYEMIDRKVRAYYPWPSAYVKDESGKIIKIFKVKRVDDLDLENEKLSGNSIIKKYGKDKILMKAKDGYVEVLDLQIEGKKRMTAREFFNGIH